MASLRTRLAALRRQARDRKGAAAMEFGLVAPILITTILAVVDIGGALQQNIRLEAAARSALGYAHVYSTDTNGIRNIVNNALTGWSNVTVNVPAMSCFCAATVNNTLVLNNTSCTNDCSSGEEQRRMLSVTVTRNYSGLVFMQNRTLTGNVQMRVQ